MKIEKGKLYYNTALEILEKATHTYEIEEGLLTDKIAVHCPTKNDWDYVYSRINYDWMYKNRYSQYNNESCLCVNGGFASKERYKNNGYHIITIDQFKQFYPPDVEQDPYVWGDKIVISNKDEVFNPQPHYDNSKGSLYKVATERGWSSYIFDVVKRLERGGKKDPLKQEIEKSIDVLKIWLNEID